MTSTQPVVLFLCVRNAGRSQMAAAFARDYGGDRVVIHSAGSAPGESLHQSVVDAMAEKGLDITGELPTGLTPEMSIHADVIVTMGCGDACPLYPGKRYLDWELPDPSNQPLDAVRQIRDDLEGRVRELIDQLLGAPS